MPEANEYIAIHILTPEDAEIAGYIDETIREKDFTSELEGSYLVLGFPSQGRVSWVLGAIWEKHFEHMPNDPGVTLKRYSRIIIDDDPTRKTFVRGR